MLGNSLLKVQRNNLKQYENDSLKILQSANQDEMAHENKDDYIYYNFNVANPSTSFNKLLLEFDVNRIDPILKNPSEYEIGIESFEISSTLPIFIENQVDFQLGVSIYDPNQDLKISFAVELFDNALIMPPFRNQYKNHVKNGVYEYARLVSAVNSALLRCAEVFNNNSVDVEFPDDDTGEIAAPFLRYFQTTGNFSLYAPNDEIDPLDPESPRLFFDQGRLFPQSSDGTNPTPQPLQIRFSLQLAKLFSGLSQFIYSNDDPEADGLYDVLMVIQDLIYTSGTQAIDNTNIVDIRGVNYMYSTTQYDCRPNMNQFNTLVFETDSVPIKDELIGTQKSIVSKRLFDYSIPPKLADRSRILYNPEYIKWSNLQSNTELRQFNMYVSFESFQGEKLLYSLQPNEKFSCKVIFRKKNTLNVSVV